MQKKSFVVSTLNKAYDEDDDDINIIYYFLKIKNAVQTKIKTEK